MRALFKDEHVSELEECLYEARKKLRRYWAGTLACLPDYDIIQNQWGNVQTQSDVDCQNILSERLSTISFKIAIYSEESDNSAALEKQEEYSLLIDPLDGTHNATIGFPGYTSSVALYYDGAYIFGWIYDISRDLVYTAALNEGAYLQSSIIVKRLRTRTTHSLAEMRVSFHRPRDTQERSRIEKIIWSAAKVRIYSCSSLEICLIAAGVLDAFIDVGPPGHERSCDIAAAELVLREAGGALFDDKGSIRTSSPPSVTSISDNGTLIALSTKELIRLLL